MVDCLVNSEINSKRITQMENAFGISGVPLNVPGRVMVGEGILMKICRKKPKSRQFFLFNDILVYGTILINKKKYAQQHIIPLEGLILEDLPNESGMKHGWLIKTPTKSFAVYAGSHIEKSQWMGHIRKCVNDLLKHSGKIAFNEFAAVWVPDSGARVCMHCKIINFTLINRRHHCRNCGSVICNNCSKNRLVILHQSNKPVRVCDTCYNTRNDHLNRFTKGLRNSSCCDSISIKSDDKSIYNSCDTQLEKSEKQDSTSKIADISDSIEQINESLDTKINIQDSIKDELKKSNAIKPLTYNTDIENSTSESDDDPSYLTCNIEDVEESELSDVLPKENTTFYQDVQIVLDDENKSSTAITKEVDGKIKTLTENDEIKLEKNTDENLKKNVDKFEKENSQKLAENTLKESIDETSANH